MEIERVNEQLKLYENQGYLVIRKSHGSFCKLVALEIIDTALNRSRQYLIFKSLIWFYVTGPRFPTHFGFKCLPI